MTASMEDQRAIIRKCDMLIVQDAGLYEVNPNFPGEKIQSQVTQEVLSRPDFEMVREVLLRDNKRIYVLRNKESLVGRGVSRE